MAADGLDGRAGPRACARGPRRSRAT